jgi:hypothetical protein
VVKTSLPSWNRAPVARAGGLREAKLELFEGDIIRSTLELAQDIAAARKLALALEIDEA